jgi:thiol-disulfide isomerase/thioredoxin
VRAACFPERGRSTSSSGLALAVLLATAAPSALDLRVVRPDGAATTLRQAVGDGPAVVAFWATYCAPCRVEVPALNRAADRWRADGLRVLGVAIETDAARVRDGAAAWGIRYDVLRLADGQDAALERLLPRGLPAAAFVAGGGGTTLHEGLLDDAALERLVPPLLPQRRQSSSATSISRGTSPFAMRSSIARYSSYEKRRRIASIVQRHDRASPPRRLHASMKFRTTSSG